MYSLCAGLSECGFMCAPFLQFLYVLYMLLTFYALDFVVQLILMCVFARFYGIEFRDRVCICMRAHADDDAEDSGTVLACRARPTIYVCTPANDYKRSAGFVHLCMMMHLAGRNFPATKMFCPVVVTSNLKSRIRLHTPFTISARRN